MARTYREQRVPLVRRVLAERPICEFPDCRALSVDVHELRSRARGGSITDESNVKACCRAHHELVTNDPAFAEAIGWSLHSWGPEPS
jgi:hypothetical protein